jgi:hypothetical protein
MNELQTTPPEEKEKKGVKDALLDWGFDFDRFESRARTKKEKLNEEYGEVREVLKRTFDETKVRMVKLAEASKPAGAELKAGFEKAWAELEKAFRKAEEKVAEDKVEPKDEE